VVDGRLVGVELGHRAVDGELVVVALDDEHHAVERVGAVDDGPQHGFRRAAVVAQLLVERIGVEGEDHGAVAVLVRRREGALHPLEVRLLAAHGLLPRRFDAQLELVVGSGEIQGREGRAAVAPARQLGVFGEGGVDVRQADERHRRLAEALGLRPEDVAHDAEDGERIGAATVRLPAVGPLVVARRVDDRLGVAVEEGALALLKFAPAVAVPLGVADVDRERRRRGVDLGDQLGVERIVVGRRVRRVAERDEGERLGGERAGAGEQRDGGEGATQRSRRHGFSWRKAPVPFEAQDGEPHEIRDRPVRGSSGAAAPRIGGVRADCGRGTSP